MCTQPARRRGGSLRGTGVLAPQARARWYGLWLEVPPCRAPCPFSQGGSRSGCVGCWLPSGPRNTQPGAATKRCFMPRLREHTKESRARCGRSLPPPLPLPAAANPRSEHGPLPHPKRGLRLARLVEGFDVGNAELRCGSRARRRGVIADDLSANGRRQRPLGSGRASHVNNLGHAADAAQYAGALGVQHHELEVLPVVGGRLDHLLEDDVLANCARASEWWALALLATHGGAPPPCPPRAALACARTAPAGCACAAGGGGQSRAQLLLTPSHAQGLHALCDLHVLGFEDFSGGPALHRHCVRVTSAPATRGALPLLLQ